MCTKYYGCILVFRISGITSKRNKIPSHGCLLLGEWKEGVVNQYSGRPTPIVQSRKRSLCGKESLAYIHAVPPPPPRPLS